MSQRFIVVGSRPWNRELFENRVVPLPGEWMFIGTPEEMTVNSIENFNPHRIFVFHWSWIISPEIYDQWETIGFHMTDLPYGRGGSPLQNLMVRGKTETVVTAIRITAVVDGGPVYLKRPMHLEGTAEDIYRRLGELSVDMMIEINRGAFLLRPQVGPVTMFDRRIPNQSELGKDCGDLSEVERFIRMLDADGYPRAFLKSGNLRIVLSDASLGDDRIVANAEITMVEDEE